jgi:hypothetical protein
LYRGEGTLLRLLTQECPKENAAKTAGVSKSRAQCAEDGLPPAVPMLSTSPTSLLPC